MFRDILVVISILFIFVSQGFALDESESMHFEAEEIWAPEMSEAESEETELSALYHLDFIPQNGEDGEDFMDRNDFDVPSFWVSDIEPRFHANYMLAGEFNSGFFGLRKKELSHLSTAQKKSIRRLKVHWSVFKYPGHENWSNKKKRRQALAVVVSFGQPTVEKVPYFIGFLFSKTAKMGEYYKPSRFSRVGRYTTLGAPEVKQWQISNIDLEKHFRTAFPGVAYPGVSGLALEVDTRGMNGVGALKYLSLTR